MTESSRESDIAKTKWNVMDQELNVNLVKNQSTCMIIPNATNFEIAFFFAFELVPSRRGGTS